MLQWSTKRLQTNFFFFFTCCRKQDVIRMLITCCKQDVIHMLFTCCKQAVICMLFTCCKQDVIHMLFTCCRKQDVMCMLFTCCCCFYCTIRYMEGWNQLMYYGVVSKLSGAEYAAIDDTLVETVISSTAWEHDQPCSQVFYHPVFVHLQVKLDGRKAWLWGY